MTCDKFCDTIFYGENMKQHEKTTLEFIGYVEKDASLKRLLEKDIEIAKNINPDKTTNPAQSLEELWIGL